MKKLKILPILILTSLIATSLPLVSCGSEEEEIYDDTTPLCFNDIKSDKQGSHISYTIDGNPLNIDIEYKIDDSEEWTDWVQGDIINLNNGQKLFVRNTTNTLSALNSYFKFVITGGKVAASGNTNSMINYSPLTQGCFNFLFADCKTLKRAPALPATTLAEHCYQNMFWNCTSLTRAPELPATLLTDYCYTAMFSGCESLKIAPELHSTTLAPHCYEQMFDICGLIIAPELPAEELAESCYECMFCHCRFKTTPALKSTKLAKRCYYYMFANCKKLVRTTDVLPATQLKESCYDHMFAYCDRLATAPKLMGQIYDKSCYLKMFKACPRLNVQEDKTSGTLICSFDADEEILSIADEMFAYADDDKRHRPWDEHGTPRCEHAYYWMRR